MKTIVFDTLQIKNFLSIGNEPIVINFKPGLNIITGVNLDKEDRQNAVGKTSIIDSIYFVLYGEALREVDKIEQLCNYRTKKVSEVKLKFQVVENNKTSEIEIVRSLKPSKCEIFIDNERKTPDSIKNTNLLITKLLHCDKDAFKNCVSMSLNNTVPFMLKEKQQKREFIESIFNLGVFSEMLDVTKKKLSIESKNLELESVKFDETNRNISTFQTQKRNFDEEKQRKIQNLNVKFEQITKEIEKNTQKLTELKKIDIKGSELKLNNKKQELEDKIKEYQANLDQVNSLITESNTKVSIDQKTLSNISKQLGSCPTCKRPFLDHDRDTLEQEKTKLQESITSENKKVDDNNILKGKCVTGISQLKTGLSTIETEKHKLRAVQNEVNILEEKNNSLTKEKKQIQHTIEEVQNSTAHFDNLIEENQVRLGKLATDIEKFKVNLTLLEKAKFVFSEEGVKAYLIKKTLDLFNNRLAYYLKQLNSRYVCFFNEYFEEEILNDLGETYSYNNLSGEERRVIDFACLFTFMDIRRLQGDVSINVSFYDELFDSSLDEKGIELVLNILKERIENYNESTFIISHRKESVKFATGEVVYLQLRNGITTRIQYS